MADSDDHAGPTVHPPALTAPVAPGDRYELIDIVRGFALFGVLVANLMWTASWFLSDEHYAAMPMPTLDTIAEGVTNFFITFKFYTLFSMLFGLGFAIQLTRATERGRNVLPTYIRRLAILFLFGVVHRVFLWFGDILHLYAMLGFVLILFRNSSDRTVLGWAAGIASVVILLPLIHWLAMTAGFHGFKWLDVSMTNAERFAAVTSGTWTGIIEVNLSTWGEAYGTLSIELDGNLHWKLNVMWKFLIGFYIGRRMLLQQADQHLALFRRVLPWALVIGVIGNALFAGALAYFHTWIAGEESALVLLWIPIEIGIVAMSAAYLCGLALLFQSARGRRLIGWLAPIGRMALTNYLMHSVFFIVLLYGVGLNWMGTIGSSATVALSIGIFGFQAVFSAWWLKHFRFGPMEWVWRSLTYGKVQPLRVTL